VFCPNYTLKLDKGLHDVNKDGAALRTGVQILLKGFEINCSPIQITHKPSQVAQGPTDAI
jgi:hypothetical protein